MQQNVHHRPVCLVVGSLIFALWTGCQPAEKPPHPSSPLVTTSKSDGSNQQEPPTEAADADSLHDEDWFESVTDDTGIQFAYHSGEDADRDTLLETLGGGAGWFDYDRDGDCDLWVTGGGVIPKDGNEIAGLPCGLFQKQDGLQFHRVDAVAGLAECRLYTQGCAAADFNRDGFPDMAVAGYGGVLLFLNQGDGTFVEISESTGPAATGWCTAVAWSDIDHDGLNDLFVARYVDWSIDGNLICKAATGENIGCGPTHYPPMTPLLFHNQGDGRFADETATRGITQKGNGLGVVAADLTGDGRCEIYFSSDETNNLYYVPAEDGRFTETGQLVGVATNEFGNAEGSMGIAVGDFDGDDRPDLFVTNFEREDDSLYHNLGNGMFLHASHRTGLSARSRTFVRFGTCFTDFDGDGWLDLVVVNGHVFRYGFLGTYRQPPQLFRNLNGLRFQEVSERGGAYFRQSHPARGLAVSDVDDDGAPDFVVVHQNEPVDVLRNRRPPGRFVRLQLHGRLSNAEAFGAKVTLRDGDTLRSQWVASGIGYFSQQDPRLLFALQFTADDVDVEVRWPSGRAERFRALDINRTHELFEGNGAAAE